MCLMNGASRVTGPRVWMIAEPVVRQFIVHYG